MKAIIKTTIAIVGVCAMLGQWTSAQMIIQHSGANNPAGAEGFTSNGGSPDGIKYATNDNGTAAWVIHKTNTTTGSFGYYKFFSGAQTLKLMNQFHVGWGFKVVNESAYPSFVVEFIQTNNTGNNMDYAVVIGTNSNPSDLRLELAIGTFITLPGAAVGFHRYDMYRTNPASDVAGFYYDGAFVTNILGYSNPGAAGWVQWNTLGASTSQIEWTSLFVEVPEPSALGVITIVAVIGRLCYRRK